MSALTRACISGACALILTAVPLCDGNYIGAMDRLLVAILAAGAVSHLAEERDDLRRKTGALK